MTTVKTRTLGRQGLTVSALGLGCMGLSQGSGSGRRPGVDHGDPRFHGESPDRNRAIVAEVRAIAVERDVEPAQFAPAWLLAQGDDVVPSVV
ncbi:hypothetical protein [Embleya sp. NPDC050493]|uniref:hypothetical protein n=1 Tax=Embleya sp. NPDC050493 TaxID=3363989 RepID=UPI0037A340EC